MQIIGKSLNPCCNGLAFAGYIVYADLCKSLNPCCNGLAFAEVDRVLAELKVCLNPCCNGLAFAVQGTI